MAKKEYQQPPPAEGMRFQWDAVPLHIRSAVEQWLGSPIVRAKSQATGFSPGVAARLTAADGRRVFAKAIGSVPNPESVTIHRKEAKIAALLPAETPAPRLLWSFDDEADSGWVVLVFEDIDGKHPAEPWAVDELKRVMHALVRLSDILTPSPVQLGDVPSVCERFEKNICGWRKLQQAPSDQVDQLDDWSRRHLTQLAEWEAKASAAVDGNSLVHIDIRGDNILLTPDKVWILDWPHACIGAAWVDVLCFAPSVTMQGGPLPEDVLALYPPIQQADEEAVTAAVISIAGYFAYYSLLPSPPGLPTLRAFQSAQGVVARDWVIQRTGWR